MKQTRQEIEFAIKKQVKEKMPLVLVERLEDGRVISVKYAEHLEVEEIKELDKQARLNRKELDEKQKLLEAELIALQKHKEESAIAQHEKELYFQKIVDGYVLFNLAIIKGLVDYPADMDKIDAWFTDFYASKATEIYDNQLLKRYCGVE